jgi:tripartite-type tricarboxylate transporter receptor subunit TctC
MGWESVFIVGDAFKTFLDEDTKRIRGILESLGLAK